MGRHAKRRSKKNIILKILRIIFLSTIIVSVSYIIMWYHNIKINADLEEKISEVVYIENKENEENTDIKYKIDFKKLKEINNQVIGWLKVNGTDIESTVVQAEDNDYYMKRNLEKNYNVGGWIFADYKNKLDGTDKNIVIYGHNMKDKSMFGSLKNILNKEWYENNENYIIEFITEKEKYKYQVFSVYKIEKEDYYINTEFKNNEFAKFIKILKNRSIKDFYVNVSEEDSILTLSTCANNNKYRIVLHAKKMME